MDADAAPRAIRTEGLNWLRDFEFGPTALVVRSTGIRIPYTPAIIAEALAWFQYFFAVKAMQACRTGQPFTIAFSPEHARPWYLIWPTVRAAGGRVVKDARNADIVMHFEDSTFSPNAPPHARADALLLNYNCRDVSKSRVGEAFERAFGYPLAIDPRTHVGPAVEKSELNGVHDGRIVTCPAEPGAGRVYQLLIDNRGHNSDLVEDLRTPTVGGKPVCVFIKRRDLKHRFTNENIACEMKRPDQVFSAAEQEKIAAFTRELGLDWGGLDVLRDRVEGRLYIVDANKTDMGPPVALPLADKLRATQMLADAFTAFLGRTKG